MIISCNLDEYELRYGTHPIIGETYAIAERENIQTGRVTGYLFKAFDADDPEGFAGNSDPSAYMFHGWRGTTNDTSVNALGVFTVLEITEQKNGISRICLSRDLHPELP